MKQLVLGILAHVDAGKTTLSEAMLYTVGSIRRLGRVDSKDAFLDNYALERARGITIFSKQAILQTGNVKLTLLDTPGHVDFSAEMERTLQVLDAAVLVISGADGVQGHTRTLWRLLARYRIPVFLFVNKMDQPGTDKGALMRQLSEELDGGCVDFTEQSGEAFFESVAMCEEGLLEQFLQTGHVEEEAIKRAVADRKVFPCFFGSALKLFGVEELLKGIETYAPRPAYPEEFGAKVYKITRDAAGNRMTHMKITGGRLLARDILKGTTGQGREGWEEKINQIRIYSGEKFEPVGEAEAGSICAVMGLTKTYPGEGLGREEESELPVLEPVLSYRVELPEGYDPALMLPKLRMLEEEDPMLQIGWNEDLKEIHAKVMGQVQIEVLRSVIAERFGVEVSFGAGSIVYKETIADRVEGVGHFEPLRHYAEVHLILEPGEPGSGLAFDVNVSEDNLARNWQRLILTHLEEKEHRGVLTGAPITDMKITLAAGRAHLKHTEGGDFRQATYRAVRHGLMMAQSVLLEPYYEFRLEIPEENIGRAMTDMEKMHGTFSLEQRSGAMAVLTGSVPVAAMQDYQKEVIAYTRGNGRLTVNLKGYGPCHNPEEVMAAIGYDPEADLANPTGSVFCAHGAGFVLPWDRVKDYMHLESCLEPGRIEDMDEIWAEELLQRKQAARAASAAGREAEEYFVGTDEIDAILSRSTHANSRQDGAKRKEGWQREKRRTSPEESRASVTRVYKGQEKREPYLLVDGYNIIYAWEDLKELAQINLDGARGKLLDILCNYQGIKKCNLIAVFDAYRVQGHPTEVLDYHNIHVVYTKEAETADRFIEKFAHDNSRKYDITVATSDGLEQIIIRGAGCKLLSARDLKEEIRLAEEGLKEAYLEQSPSEKNYLGELVKLPTLPE
ncbi:MAG: TetM/TetW/TetO/TetS family tetracycline resistance ribosomal protection protein [Lachnospiraceae bacterium]|nr:TetM/TetW/TetO/TetS family tetracycline resistance ribosomal protection protein [Lachnospiraceae bacterium]